MSGPVGASSDHSFHGAFGRGEETPLAGDALQCMSSAVDESEAGTGNEVLDGRGDENLVRLRTPRDAGSEVYRNSQHLVAHHLAFAGVQARPNCDPRVSD